MLTSRGVGACWERMRHTFVISERQVENDQREWTAQTSEDEGVEYTKEGRLFICCGLALAGDYAFVTVEKEVRGGTSHRK